MAFLAINNTVLPSPKRGVKITVSTLVDAGRNANGVVIGQRIGRDQYKIDNLEWSVLTAEEWSQILSLVSSFYFYVTFTDPVTNSIVTRRMYCGDRHAEPYFVDDEDHPTLYVNCKVNLIDTGE